MPNPVISDFDSDTCCVAKTKGVGVNRYIPSSECIEIRSKPAYDKRTNVRCIRIDGYCLGLNTHEGKYEVRLDIVWQAFKQMIWMLQKYKRLCQIRLETPTFISESECSKFRRAFKQLIEMLKRHYTTAKVGYLYVREKSSNRGWHYHVVLWIDGKKCNSGHVAWELWNQILWKAELLTKMNKDEKLNELRKVESRLVHLKDRETIFDATYGWSYLAKPRTKGRGAAHSRDFVVSQVAADR